MCTWERGAESGEDIRVRGGDGRGVGAGRLTWGEGSELGGREEWGEREKRERGGKEKGQMGTQ